MVEMVKVATVPLVIIFVGTLLAAYAIAWFYRAEYNPLKYLKAYLIYAVPLLGLGLALRVKIVLLVGTYIFGGIVLIFRNQHYFDK